jgi:hypothetical protein
MEPKEKQGDKKKKNTLQKGNNAPIDAAPILLIAFPPSSKTSSVEEEMLEIRARQILSQESSERKLLLQGEKCKSEKSRKKTK